MKVSVVIPCYNVAPYLQRCLDHVFGQSYRNLEVICVNDGSRDDTLQLLRTLETQSPFPFQIIDQPNQGAPAARNAALALATGSYVQFLDADDVILPNKIAHQVHLAEQNGLPELIIGSSRTLSSTGTLLVEIVQSTSMRDPWLDLMANDLNVTSTLLFKTEAVREAGGWDNTLKSSQEYNLIFRMLQRGARLVFDDQVLTEIHKRGGSITQTNLGDNWVRFVQLRARILDHVRRTQPGMDLKPYYQVLFDSIRVLYPLDPPSAVQFYKELVPADFTPTTSRTTRPGYLLMHGLLGFSWANKLRALVHGGHKLNS